MTARWQRLWNEQPELTSAFLVCVVALGATVTSLANGFAYDDIPILVDHWMVKELQAPWEYLRESYWGPLRGNSLYRPLTLFAFALERAAGGGDPFPFHVMNVALYVGACLAVLALCRELLPGGAALLAALLWAAHPVHVEAVGNGVGQAELLAAVPMLLAVVFYIRARTLGALSVRTRLAIMALFVTALLSKEHGILLPGLLALTEIAFRGRQFRAAEGVDRSLWSLGKALVAIIALYLAVRYAVIGTALGDTPHPALAGLTPPERAWVMLGLLPELARLLVWPAALYSDYSPQAVPFLVTPALGHLPGLAILLAFAWAVLAAWRRDRSGTALFALLWLPATWLLVSNVLFASGVVLAERTLLLPSLSVTVLCGYGAVRLHGTLVRSSATIRRALAGGVAGLLLIATVHSATRQRIWVDNATVFATLVVEAPDNYKGHFAVAEIFGNRAEWARAEFHLRAADSLFPNYEFVQLALGRLYHTIGRCPEALTYYEKVTQKLRDFEVALIGRTACLLELAHLTAAWEESVQGVARGNSAVVFQALRQKAESALVANDTLDLRNRWYRAGRPVSKSTEPIRFQVLLSDTVLPPPGRRKTPAIVPDSVP